MPFALSKDFVLLCEGPVDKAFFRKIIALRNLPEFDMPFPQDDRDEGEELLSGKDKFAAMLSSLRGAGFRYEAVKLILIAVDSRDQYAATFKEVCTQIAAAGKLGIPTKDVELAKSEAGHPAIAIILVPGERAGSLETLCVEAIAAGKADLLACVDAFLQCDSIEAHKWNAEPRDKARLQCMIAATNKDDPNKAVRYLFGKLIDMKSPAFTDIGNRLEGLCNEAKKL